MLDEIWFPWSGQVLTLALLTTSSTPNPGSSSPSLGSVRFYLKLSFFQSESSFLKFLGLNFLSNFINFRAVALAVLGPGLGRARTFIRCEPIIQPRAYKSKLIQ